MAKKRQAATTSDYRMWASAAVVLIAALVFGALFGSTRHALGWGAGSPSAASVDAPGLWLRVIRAGNAGDADATRNGTVWVTEATFARWTEPAKAKGRLIAATTGETLLTWPSLLAHASAAAGLQAAPASRAAQANANARADALEVLLDAPRVSSSSSSSSSSSGRSSSSGAGEFGSIAACDGDGGVPFVWPPRAVGHRVELTDLQPYPRGADTPVVLETLATSPKVFYVHNFLSDAEADALVAFAQDTAANPYALRPSTTGHKSWTEGGEASVNSKRTSLNGFDVSSATSAAIKRRAFALAKVDPYFEGQSDGIQVLKYAPAQAYVPHTDYFALDTSEDHNWDARAGGTNRFATVFLYLSDVEAGGETVFPKVWPSVTQAAAQADAAPARAAAVASGLLGDDPGSWEAKMSGECGSRFAVTPKKGDALLFYSQEPDGTLDPLSIHGGCPVLNGTKWAANVWIWNGCRYSVCKNVPKPK